MNKSKKDLLEIGKQNVSADTLADLLCVSQVQISNYCKDGMPKVGTGKYPLRECIQWYAKKNKTKISDAHTAEDAAKLRQAEAKAELMEIELALERERYIEVDDALESLGETLSAVKSSLMSLSTRVAPQVLNVSTAAEVEATIKKYVVETLEELAELPNKLGALEVKDTNVDESE